MSCPECTKKDREIRRLVDTSQNYRDALHVEMKRTCVLSEALQKIYEMARNKMWYPCSFEDHEAVDAAQRRGIDADLEALNR